MDRRAIGAAVAGIAAVYFSASILVFILAPVAIWLGRQAGRRIQASEGSVGGRGFARVGFWAGIASLVLLAVFVVLAINYDFIKATPDEVPGKVSDAPA
jgi:hypothetical protein